VFPNAGPPKAAPKATGALILDYLRAAMRRLSKLASCLALVALLVLIVILKIVMRIPDLEGIDD
jgi:hypothetical protein